MTTIVNTPANSNGNGGNMMGMIIGLFVLIIGTYIFFVYGLPAISQMRVGAPQINVPNKIDVNVKQSK